MKISFTVFGHPVPQGSLKSFVIPGKNGKKPRSILVADNKKQKPFRQEVSQTAMVEAAKIGTKPLAGKHVPVRVELEFYLEKPASVKKSRLWPSVKPDADKLIRLVLDACTGILWQDDAQVVAISAVKCYGVPERVVIRMFELAECSVKLPFETLEMFATP